MRYQIKKKQRNKTKTNRYRQQIRGHLRGKQIGEDEMG